jgi:hypothetical protein
MKRGTYKLTVLQKTNELADEPKIADVVEKLEEFQKKIQEVVSLLRQQL